MDLAPHIMWVVYAVVVGVIILFLVRFDAGTRRDQEHRLEEQVKRMREAEEEEKRQMLEAVKRPDSSPLALERYVQYEFGDISTFLKARLFKVESNDKKEVALTYQMELSQFDFNHCIALMYVILEHLPHTGLLILTFERIRPATMEEKKEGKDLYGGRVWGPFLSFRVPRVLLQVKRTGLTSQRLLKIIEIRQSPHPPHKDVEAFRLQDVFDKGHLLEEIDALSKNEFEALVSRLVSKAGISVPAGGMMPTATRGPPGVAVAQGGAAAVAEALQAAAVDEEAQKRLRSLEEMNRQLEAKVRQQVEDLEKAHQLTKFVAPQVLQTLEADKEGGHREAQRKLLTIFFSDVRGFTQTSSALEPEELFSLLNQYLSEMTKLIFKWGGTIDKFMGDGIMVFFGDPTPQEDHAERAVRMAVDMQRKVAELRERWDQVGREFQVGIGINSGYATVGTIGSEERMDYTVIGTQVNVASRLQSQATSGQIFVSQRTYSLVKDFVDAEPVGELQVKGVPEPVKTFNITGLRR